MPWALPWAIMKTGRWPSNHISLLCFLWILIWMICSCFSTMLSSPMLLGPPALAVLVALVVQPPRGRDVIGAAGISGLACVLALGLGWGFARGDSVSLNRDGNGMITVTNNKIKAGKTCVLCVDQQALGEEYGKGVRKFLTGSDFGRCVVVDRVAQALLPVPEFSAKSPQPSGTDRSATFKTADLIILSGNTVGQVEIMGGPAKYVLLNPAFLPGDMPGGAVQAIVYPEIKNLFFAPSVTFCGHVFCCRF